LVVVKFIPKWAWSFGELARTEWKWESLVCDAYNCNDQKTGVCFWFRVIAVIIVGVNYITIYLYHYIPISLYTYISIYLYNYIISKYKNILMENQLLLTSFLILESLLKSKSISFLFNLILPLITLISNPLSCFIFL